MLEVFFLRLFSVVYIHVFSPDSKQSEKAIVLNSDGGSNHLNKPQHSVGSCRAIYVLVCLILKRTTDWSEMHVNQS